MVATANKFTQSLPCTLVVFQYYKTVGIDSALMALYQAFLSKEDEQVIDLPESINRRLHIPVSREKTIRNKQSLCNSAIIELNQIIELMIRDLIRAAFLEELESCRRNQVKLRIKQVIDGVLERFGLSEEAKSFDAVKKDLYRFCKAKKIDYKSLKKVWKPVPKLAPKSQFSQVDGVPLKNFLKYKGYSKQWFYFSERHKYITFKIKGCLFIHLDSIPKEDVSFVAPKQRVNL